MHWLTYHSSNMCCHSRDNMANQKKKKKAAPTSKRSARSQPRQTGPSHTCLRLVERKKCDPCGEKAANTSVPSRQRTSLPSRPGGCVRVRKPRQTPEQRRTLAPVRNSLPRGPRELNQIKVRNFSVIPPAQLTRFPGTCPRVKTF